MNVCFFFQFVRRLQVLWPAALVFLLSQVSYAQTWTHCANENEYCSFSGTKTVRFGANGKYATTTATDGVPCSNMIFGDPAYGFQKACDIASSGTTSTSTPTPTPTPVPTPAPTPAPTPMPTPVPDTSNWIYCASENQFCTFSGTHTVRFGANGKFSTATATGGVPCSNMIFGDPAYGYQKACSIASVTVSSTPTPAPTAIPTPVPTPIPAPIATPLPTPAPNAQSPYVPSGYALTFDDEFTSLGTISSGPIPYSPSVKWYNGIEQCCMGPSDGKIGSMFPTLVNGTKVVNPYSLDSQGGLNISLTLQGNWWNSGVMQTVDASHMGFSQQYGYFEIMAQFPSGPGAWPAFWMLPANPTVNNNQNHGEIDIFEGYTQFQNGFCITLHDWNNDANSGQDCFNNLTQNVTAGYHVYAMLWTPTTMSFYFDGQLIYQHPTLAVMQAPYYLLVDLGIGGGWPTENTPSPSVMKVKYIRAYKQAP